MKKSKKRIKIILIIFFLFITIFTSTNVFAINPEEYRPPAIENGGKVQTIGNIIIGGIQFIGSIVSVIVLIIIGIKFLIGSAEEKAEYKELMTPYLIGALMLLGISNLLGIISDIFS